MLVTKSDWVTAKQILVLSTAQEFWYPSLFKISWYWVHNQIHSRYFSYVSYVEKVQIEDRYKILVPESRDHMECNSGYLRAKTYNPGYTVVTNKY